MKDRERLNILEEVRWSNENTGKLLDLRTIFQTVTNLQHKYLSANVHFVGKPLMHFSLSLITVLFIYICEVQDIAISSFKQTNKTLLSIFKVHFTRSGTMVR